jgi:putative AlgH/UPF0301 family transcriptional regulator
MQKMNFAIIVKALEESRWLISDEYSAVIDDDIKQKYEEVLEKIDIALKEIKEEE